MFERKILDATQGTFFGLEIFASFKAKLSSGASRT